MAEDNGKLLLSALEALADAQKAKDMAAYHKVSRRYLGVSNADINQLATDARRSLSLEARLAAADALWTTDIHEARIAAAKLLTQARIKGDGPVWDMILGWVPQFDAWAIADAVSSAGERRLVAAPERLDMVEGWTRAEHMWSRRAALVMTLPWAKQRYPSEAEAAARTRILGWAAGYTSDPEWFIQKAVSWWLRTLSRRDPERVQAFMAEHGDQMKAFARKDALRLIE